MECDAAPPSLQFANTYCVPVEPAWGVATAIVCEPCDRFTVFGAVCAAPPSTLNMSPVGLVCIVIAVSAAGLIVMERVTLVVSSCESVTVNDGLKPPELVGVPFRTPAELMLNPGGIPLPEDQV